MKKLKQFAASGSLFDDRLEIIGTLKDGYYKSDIISGKLTQEFWEELSLKAKDARKFIYLMF